MQIAVEYGLTNFYNISAESATASFIADVHVMLPENPKS